MSKMKDIWIDMEMLRISNPKFHSYILVMQDELASLRKKVSDQQLDIDSLTRRLKWHIAKPNPRNEPSGNTNAYPISSSIYDTLKKQKGGEETSQAHCKGVQGSCEEEEGVC